MCVERVSRACACVRPAGCCRWTPGVAPGSRPATCDGRQQRAGCQSTSRPDLGGGRVSDPRQSYLDAGVSLDHLVIVVAWATGGRMLWARMRPQHCSRCMPVCGAAAVAAAIPELLSPLPGQLPPSCARHECGNSERLASVMSDHLDSDFIARGCDQVGLDSITAERRRPDRVAEQAGGQHQGQTRQLKELLEGSGDG